VDVDSRLVGVVDVLKLTYATLEQINSMNEESGGEGGGPMWNRFWNSFGQTGSAAGGGGDDNESAMSGSHRPSEMHEPQTPSKYNPSADMSSDLHPNDSASAVGGTRANDDAMSGVNYPSGIAPAAAAEVDDGTYLFKFVTPSGRTHRFQARYDSFETIREIVTIKLESDPFFEELPAPTVAEPAEGEEAAPQPPKPSAPDANDFTLAYTDDEEDVVLITADGDVLDAVQVARKQGRDRVVLLLQGGRGWEEAAARVGAPAASTTSANLTANSASKQRKAREAAEAQLQSVQEEEEREQEAEVGERAPTNAKKVSRTNKNKEEQEVLFGFLPKDLALPAAIGFLGVAVLVGIVVAKPK